MLPLVQEVATPTPAAIMRAAPRQRVHVRLDTAARERAPRRTRLRLSEATKLHQEPFLRPRPRRPSRSRQTRRPPASIRRLQVQLMLQ